MRLDLLQRTVIDNPFIPINPTEPQAVFLTLPVKESLYGGAAGGGKSAALLAAALQYVTEPRYAALLLRRSFADLLKPESLIPLSKEWLSGTGATWNGTQYQWTFPSGATLSFGYCDTDNDIYTYQGAAYQFVGWDELTQFTEKQYRYLFSRMRRKKGDPANDVPVRMRAASNPGGVGHEWVRQRFLEEGRKAGRYFVPAKLDDNPYLDKDEYERSLAELDPVTRAQLREGDWQIRPEGNLFKRAWFDIVDHCPTGKTVRFWDLAATEEGHGTDPDYTAGAKLVQANGCYYLADLIRMRGRPQEIESIVKQTAMADGIGVAVRIEEEPGSAGKSLVSHYTRDILPGFDARGVRSVGDKVTRSMPFSAACERRDVKIVRGNWIGAFLDELCAFPEVAHDDQVDACTGAFNQLHQAYKLNLGSLFKVGSV